MPLRYPEPQFILHVLPVTVMFLKALIKYQTL